MDSIITFHSSVDEAPANLFSLFMFPLTQERMEKGSYSKSAAPYSQIRISFRGGETFQKILIKVINAYRELGVKYPKCQIQIFQHVIELNGEYYASTKMAERIEQTLTKLLSPGVQQYYYFLEDSEIILGFPETEEYFCEKMNFHGKQNYHFDKVIFQIYDTAFHWSPETLSPEMVALENFRSAIKILLATKSQTEVLTYLGLDFLLPKTVPEGDNNSDSDFDDYSNNSSPRYSDGKKGNPPFHRNVAQSDSKMLIKSKAEKEEKRKIPSALASFANCINNYLMENNPHPSFILRLKGTFAFLYHHETKLFHEYYGNIVETMPLSKEIRTEEEKQNWARITNKEFEKIWDKRVGTTKGVEKSKLSLIQKRFLDDWAIVREASGYFEPKKEFKITKLNE